MMTEDQIKEADSLLKIKRLFETALQSSVFVSKIEVDTDWACGCRFSDERKHMVEAVSECRVICDVILSRIAKTCLAQINRKLKALGVSVDED